MIREASFRYAWSQHTIAAIGNNSRDLDQTNNYRSSRQFPSKLLLPTGIGLSARRHVPIVYFCSGSFYFHSFLKLAWQWRKLSVLQRDEKEVVIRHDQTVMRIELGFAYAMVREWYGPWTRYYLPGFPLADKTVLDVGAGCGETAYFYLSHGAKKVVCIEPNTRRFELLQENARRNDWNVETAQLPFDVSILERYDYDFMKMDCEGCESELLTLREIPPCAIEVHGDSILKGLMGRFHGGASPKSKETDTWLFTFAGRQN